MGDPDFVEMYLKKDLPIENPDDDFVDRPRMNIKHKAIENPEDDFVDDTTKIDRNSLDETKVVDWVVNSEPEAYDLYCRYAHETGFSVRKEHHSYWPNSRQIKDKDYVCSKAGNKKDSKLNVNPKYRKSNTRSGCPAMIRFFVDRDGIWTVKSFVQSHNHELAKNGDRHLLRSARFINNDKAAVLKSMTESGIRPVNAFSYLAEEVGGVQNIGFTKRDAYNFIQQEKRSKIENGDTNTLIQLFRDRQTTDNMFVWDVQFDENDRLLNFFWVDGTGRIDYDCFGDVIIFDTSYRLNKYNLACAPIVAVNNHWQNVLVGVAFLSEETIESFTWLFKTFLRVMGDKHPTTIFTDQDQAMARAIEVALPYTRHRLCQWHISKKAPSKIGCFNSNKKCRGLFYKCLSKCDSEEEFDEAWNEMILSGDLQNHAWLNDLYRIRHKWSTAFNKNVFSIGILSTQRSESTNNVCHGISKPTSSITDCFLGLERIMTTWRRNEADEDFKCGQTETVPIVKGSPMLNQAAKFYSRELYKLFEAEFLNGTGAMTLQKSPTNSTEYYIKSLPLDDHSKTWVVNFQASEGIIQCSCKKFEMMGLLCGHCIRVLNLEDVFLIPSHYLLPRWSYRAKQDYFFEKRSNEAGTSHKGSEMIFRNHISKMAYEMASRAQGNSKAEEHMRSIFEKLSNDIDLLVTGKSINSLKRKGTKQNDNMKCKDPAKVRPKGVSNARLKGYFEKGKRRKGPISTSQYSCEEIAQREQEFDAPIIHFSSMPEPVIEKTNSQIL